MVKYRDLTIVDITPDHRIVISCDSSGGIGDKDMDVVKTDPETVGYFTTQVALMELLATGATPVTIVNTLGVEMEETGQKIIKGIKKALKPLNLQNDIVITGSTEENIPVCQTSIGITIIGRIEKSNWRRKKAKKRDLAVVVGIPKVGHEVLDDRGRETMSVPILLELLSKPYINDILPVGSKGIAYELKEMADTNGLSYNIYDKLDINLEKSAGPATCAILAVDREGYEDLKKSISIPVKFIGIFV